VGGAAENDYGIVKAWFNGKPATIEGINLKIYEHAEIRVEITTKTNLDFIAIQLYEPGVTNAFEVIEGPSKIEEWINYWDVEKNWSKNFTWKVRPNGGWVDGNAPINIFVQFKKAYGYTSGYDSKEADFSVANPYILNERYSSSPSTSSPTISPNPSIPSSSPKSTPGFELFLAFCALAGTGLLAARRR